MTINDNNEIMRRFIEHARELHDDSREIFDDDLWAHVYFNDDVYSRDNYDFACRAIKIIYDCNIVRVIDVCESCFDDDELTSCNHRDDFLIDCSIFNDDFDVDAFMNAHDFNDDNA